MPANLLKNGVLQPRDDRSFFPSSPIHARTRLFLFAIWRGGTADRAGSLGAEHQRLHVFVLHLQLPGDSPDALRGLRQSEGRRERGSQVKHRLYEVPTCLGLTKSRLLVLVRYHVL